MRKEIQVCFFVVVFGLFLSQTSHAFAITQGTGQVLTISNITVSNITSTSSEIHWETNLPVMPFSVSYGLISGKLTSYLTEPCYKTTPNIVATTTPCIRLINLSDSSTYYYKINSYVLGNTNGSGGFTQVATSSEMHFITVSNDVSQQQQSQGQLPPARVTSLQAATSSPNQLPITISWAVNDKSQTRFELTRTDTRGTIQVLSSSILPTTFSFMDTGIQLAGTYTYGIVACNDGGCSATTTTTITLSVPAAPSSLSSSLTTEGILLEWKDVVNATRFTIYRATSTANPLISVGETGVGIVRYIDKNTTPGTYIYAVDACNSLGCSSNKAYSQKIIPEPSQSDPLPPTGLEVSTTTTPSIILSWGSVQNATSYKVTRISLTTSVFPSITNITSATRISYEDKTVSPGTYSYTIQACNNNPAGTAICSTSLESSSIIIPSMIPGIPGNVHVATTSIYSARITWVDTSNETMYKVSKSFNGGSFIPFSQNLGANYVYYDDNGLIPGNYTYKVQACNQTTLQLSCSNEVTTGTLIIPTPTTPPVTPGLPTNLRVATTTPNSATVYWTAATNQTGYKISKTVNSGNSILLYTTGPNATSYVNNNLNAGTHTYYVQACNGSSCSSEVFAGSVMIPDNKSDVVATTTPILCFGFDNRCAPQATSTEITVPDSPVSAKVQRAYVGGILSPSTLHLSWVATSTNAIRYKIYRSTLSSSTDIVVNDPKTTSYDDYNLPPETYTYYIYTCNKKDCSPYAAKTNTIILPVMDTTTPSVADLLLLQEISNAVGKVTPGTFINIIPTTETALLTGSTKTFTATALADGSFQVKVPDGTYIIEGIIPQKVVTLLYGKVTKLIDNIVTSTKTITGAVTLADGTPVQNAEVSAYKKETNEWLVGTVDRQGAYTIKVSPGTWELTVHAKDGTATEWEVPSILNTVSFSTENTNESKPLNIIVVPLASQLTIIVKDTNGNPIPSIGVTMDTVSALDTTMKGILSSRKIITKTTDIHGSVILRSPIGKYFVRTSLPSTAHYAPSKEASIVLSNNQARTLTIILKKEISVTTSKIIGITKFNDGTPTKAFVSAWSNEGGKVAIKTTNRGAFSLPVAIGQTWHIKAIKDASGKSYTTDEQTILTTVTPKTIDLTFVQNEALTLPTTVTTQKDTTEQTMLSSDNGARFTLPANAVTSSGKIDVTIQPTTEVTSSAASTLVSNAYDITVKNTDGEHLTKLAETAEILIPYDEKELAAKGVALQDIVPSYYDETLKTWISVPTFTINTIKKVFVLHVNHLTRFALIAAADTTAPSSPTNIVTDYITPTDVRITWENPNTDFNHSKIYRSEKQGTFGDVIASEVFSNSFIDKTSSQSGKVFYYTIRAVDAAGNESGNNNQIAFESKGNGLAQVKTTSLLLPPGQELGGQLTRQLSLGSKGGDVTSLQKALKLDGFYATGPITGYYGRLTENAVFRFQNYYKKELLIPNGYKMGTGVVGPITMKKINEIIVNGAQ